MIKLSLALLLSSFPLLSHAESPSPEIRVHLATENTLSPIYLSRLQWNNASFDSSYQTQLEAILQYDLNYNGSTSLLPRVAEKEQVLQSSSTETAFNPTFWKKNHTPYVIKWSVTGKTLSLSAFSTQSGSLKHFGDIALSGDIHVDRKQIHKLADGIQKTLFNVDGVANSRLLFSYQVKNSQADGSEWLSEIWECDWDGANTRQVTHEKSYCVTPVMLPSAKASDRFLYVSYKLGQPKIYIASLKDGSGKRLIDLPGNQLLPAVSSQKDKIAFICDAGGRTDLFLQSLNSEGEGSKPIQLYSYPRSTQASPTFSPDGSKIAFVSDKDSGMRIYIIPTSSGDKRANAVMISKLNRENSCPSWSPDGTKLAYSAKTNNVRQVWIYDFASGEEWQLTSGPSNKENPCWASNSNHLVFNSTDGSSSELYIVNLNQPEAVKITRGPGKKHYPAWGTR